MLLSFLNKSKLLLGVGKSPETGVEATETSVEATALDDHNGNAVNLQRKNEELRDTIYDLIRTIRDPEKPATLEDLHVVNEEDVFVQPATPDGVMVVRIEFNPTVPHCSLATLIGLCIRIKLVKNLAEKFKLDIYIKEGTHSTEEEINKQINDKERIAAAMENPNLRDLVEGCIEEVD